MLKNLLKNIHQQIATRCNHFDTCYIFTSIWSVQNKNLECVNQVFLVLLTST